MSKYKDKPNIKIEEMGVNPYRGTFEIVVNLVKSSDKYKVWDKAMGEDAIYELANFEHEAVPYTKVFNDSRRRLAMVKLSPRTKDLYLWIIYEAEKNKEFLWINKVRYMEESEVTAINTYRGAVNELIKKGFMIRSTFMDTYWLNPDYFFNGDRVKKFPEEVKRK